MNESPKHEEDYRGYTIVVEKVVNEHVHILTDRVVAYVIMTANQTNLPLFRQMVDTFIKGK